MKHWLVESSYSTPASEGWDWWQHDQSWRFTMHLYKYICTSILLPLRWYHSIDHNHGLPGPYTYGLAAIGWAILSDRFPSYPWDLTFLISEHICCLCCLFGFSVDFCLLYLSQFSGLPLNFRTFWQEHLLAPSDMLWKSKLNELGSFSARVRQFLLIFCLTHAIPGPRRAKLRDCFWKGL